MGKQGKRETLGHRSKHDRRLFIQPKTRKRPCPVVVHNKQPKQQLGPTPLSEMHKAKFHERIAHIQTALQKHAMTKEWNAQIWKKCHFVVCFLDELHVNWQRQTSKVVEIVERSKVFENDGVLWCFGIACEIDGNPVEEVVSNVSLRSFGTLVCLLILTLQIFELGNKEDQKAMSKVVQASLLGRL